MTQFVQCAYGILNTRYSVVLLLVALLFIFGTCFVEAEKIPSILTIGTVPEFPQYQGFHVTGTLMSVSGEALGNKRVTLESSLDNPDDPKSFSYLAITETGKTGTFQFYRPDDTPPEFLRVRFPGNSQYEAAVSPVISTRGAGTNSPLIRPGKTGSITVSTSPAGADIYVDGIYRGISPNMIGGLNEGSHTLDVGKPGFQNETMEAYVSSMRRTSFSLTLNPAGLGLTQTGISSSLSYTQNMSEPEGTPDFFVNMNGISMRLYGNVTNTTGSSDDLKITTLESVNPVNGGHEYMVIMTDH
jgi:hypothetical protein